MKQKRNAESRTWILPESYNLIDNSVTEKIHYNTNICILSQNNLRKGS